MWHFDMAVSVSGLGDEIRALLLAKKSWSKDADCKLTDADMYPSGALDQIKLARTKCHGCPVQKQCLTLALTTKEKYGVWGGTTEDERQDLAVIIEKSCGDVWSSWDSDSAEAIEAFADTYIDRYKAEVSNFELKLVKRIRRSPVK